MSDSGHIPPPNPPEWLPAGWTMEVRSNKGKNVKSYVNQLTGCRFYSKPKVLEYLGTVKNNSWMPQKETAGNASNINFSEDINVTVGSFPHGWVTETPPKENGSQSGKSYEVGVSEMLQYGEMVAEKSPDWLPAGWTEEIKERNGRTVKTYVDPLWGHRFYSKPQVLQYLGVAMNDNCTAQRETVGNNSESNLVGRKNGTPERLPHVSTLTTPWENSSHSKLEASELPHSHKIVVEKRPDWLPAGWIEEVKISNGRSIKCYVDSSTGRKFYSKPKVLEYLGKAKIDEGTSQKKKIGNDFDINLPIKINDPPESLPHGHITELETRENGSGAGGSYKLTLETIDDSLPDGWITEVKHRKIGSLDGKPYKQYIDPVTGRKFLSKQKVFEYLGTVKPNSSTSRRRKTVLDDSNLSADKIEGVTPTPQPVEPQNGKTLNDAVHSSTSKGKSYRNRPGRKPNVDTSGSGIPPHLVETQNMKTVDDTGYKSILKETSSSEQPGRKISMEHLSPQGLPPGWTKDIKIQKTGNKTRKISYYIDPVSGYVFSSLMDAWRYVEAGDISKCVVKPKKREEMGFATDQSSPNMNKIVSNPPSQLLEGDRHVNTRKSTRFSPENGKLSSSKQCDSKPLERIKHVNTRNKMHSSPEDGKISSSKQCDSEPNADKIASNTPSQLLEGTKHVNTRKRTRVSPEDRNLSSSKQYDGEIVIERVAAEGLPSGWIKEVKIEKFYTDLGSGYVFMSQKDALCYLETGDIGKCAIKPRSREELGLNEGATITSASGQLTKENETGGPPLQQLEQSQNEYTPRLTRSRQKKMTSGKQSGQEIVLEKVTTKGLPSGSIKEDSVQKEATGTRTDASVLEKVTPKGLPSGSIREDSVQKKATGTGTDTLEMNKTRGKRALQQLKQSHTVSTPKHATFSSPQNEMTANKQSGKEIVIERVSPEGLPPGWIKEIRIQKKADGIRRDTYYTDPVNGYVFSSQKDVFRYVETGDINNCAMKPRNRDQLGLNQGSSATSPPVMEKPGHDTTKKQLSTGKNVSSKRSLETMDSDVSQKRRQTRSSVASPPVMLKLECDTAKKQLSAATNVGSKRSLETMETDVPTKRRQTRASASAFATKNPAVELPKEVAEVDNVIQKPTKAKRGTKNSGVELMEEVPKVGNVNQKPTKSKKGTKNPNVELPKEVPTVGDVIQKPMKAKKGNGSSRSPLPKGKVSSRKRGGVRSPPTTKNLQLKNVKKSTTKTSSKGKTISPTSQTKKEAKKETRKPPSRFSKRILGLNTKTPNSGSSEQALTAVANPGEKDDILCINVPSGVASCEKALASDVENSGKKEGNPGPCTPNNVASCEQVLTLELDNSGKDQNVPCPIAPNNVNDNVPQQLETVPERGKIEVEKLGEIEEIQCANSPADVTINAPQQLETVPELDKPNHASGGSAETPSGAEVSNKNNEATEDQAECQTVSQEQPAEVLNKGNEARGEEQAEDQTVSVEKPAMLSNTSKEAMEDQADDPIVSLEPPAEVSNKSKEAVEDQADDATVPPEQPAEVSNKSKETVEDHAENQTVSQDQNLYQFGEETWSDPCLDFAFKTLTGALPFEDNAQVQNIFQLRADGSQVKTADNCLTLLDFGAPNVREVNPPHAQKDSKALHQGDNSDAQNGSEAPPEPEPEPVSQLHGSPVFLPDMNSSLPSGSETAPQKVDSEENTNNDKNVLTLDNYARFLF